MITNYLNQFWKVENNGFLPNIEDSRGVLFGSPYDVPSKELVSWNEYGTTRKEIINCLESLHTDIELDLKDIEYELEDNRYAMHRAETLMRFLSYLASSYVHVPGQEKVNLLPKIISSPFVKISNLLNRLPILSYASYCLYNWTCYELYGLDARKEVGNIGLVQNFCSPNKSKKDEDWFILIHVDIEYKAAKGISAINKMLNSKDLDLIKTEMQNLLESLVAMNVVLKRMPEQCSPDVYYLNVRPYIFSFENIIYEGEFNNVPQTFRGETGAQSSIVPAMQTFLGVKHQESILTTHLQDMRNYMPSTHREYLVNLENNGGIRDFIIQNQDDKCLKNLYNSCVGQLFEFRRQHLSYAVEYIFNKVPDPKGTGGTPYINWLSQLAKETESFYL
jgi:indoleamine 2,3-dioxygenase